MSAYILNLLILISINSILGMSLQLTMGYTGLFNLGHISFYAIGAYASVLLSKAGFSFFFSIVFASLISAFIGFIFSLLIRKIKGDYLALASLAFSFLVYAILLNWKVLTNGSLGIHGIPKPDFWNIDFTNNFNYFLLVLFVFFVSYIIIKRIVSSPYGKVLEAIRDEELAVRVLGKDSYKAKSYAMATSAFFAAIAGCLYAHYVSFVDPSGFSIMQIIPIVSIVIIGGLASLEGTIIASVALMLLPEPLRFIGFPSSVIGPMRQILYSITLIVILYFKPKGFFGKVELE